MIQNKVLMLVVALAAAGCSNKAMYDSVRIQQRNECLQEPPPTYFECIERTNKTYEEYERERKALLEAANASGSNKRK